VAQLDTTRVRLMTYHEKPTLVSKRVGCIILRPSLDLTAVCLKR
jgi:hypothetical protein